MSIIVELGTGEGLVIESDRVNIAVVGLNGEDASDCVVGGIHLYNWGDEMMKNRG